MNWMPAAPPSAAGSPRSTNLSKTHAFGWEIRFTSQTTLALVVTGSITSLGWNGPDESAAGDSSTTAAGIGTTGTAREPRFFSIDKIRKAVPGRDKTSMI